MAYKGGKLGETLLTGKRRNPLDDIIPEEILAEILGCCAATIASYREKEELPFIKVGRDCYYSATSVLKWFLERETANNGNNQKKSPLGKTSKGSKTQAI